MIKLYKLIKILFSPSKMVFLLSTPYSGYLKDIGWFESFAKKEPVDNNLKPLAWVTYPFIHFIEPRLCGLKNIFEYGSGNSTLYYSRFVNKVVSLEHDRSWYVKVANRMPENVELFYCEMTEGGRYSKFSSECSEKFDLIIVDGRDRVNSMVSCLDSLTEGGVVVLDDSERCRYERGVNFLMGQGFKRVDFWGISPGLFYKKCTTIFYRNENVLGI